MDHVLETLFNHIVQNRMYSSLQLSAISWHSIGILNEGLVKVPNFFNESLVKSNQYIVDIRSKSVMENRVISKCQESYFCRLCF